MSYPLIKSTLENNSLQVLHTPAPIMVLILE